MDCGSKFVWVNDESDALLELDDDTTNLWSDDVNVQTLSTNNPSSLPPPPVQPAHKPTTATKKKRVRVQEANTNVLSVNFGTLIQSAQHSTGDPIYCSGCRAVVNSNSKLVSKDKDQQFYLSTQLWTCEFCDTVNEIQLDPEEIPKVDTVDYILEPPTSKTEGSSAENVLVICIDISGSMGVTYEVKGKVKLRGDEKKEKLQSSVNVERNAHGVYAEQFLPNEKRDVTYVSRLQCVQGAIGSQIEQLVKDNPNYPVAIVTFNNEVTLFGDGTLVPVSISGDKLQNYDACFETGTKFNAGTLLPVSKSKDSLLKKLFSLEEEGSTALGPALVASVGMCSNSRGSKIVICTDGLSNVGVGSMDDLFTDDDKDRVSKFYENIGLYSKGQGITISVVSIKGSDCSIENLGQLSDLTSGNVDRVDPLDITKNFQAILSLPVVATHVTATLNVHRGLFLKTQDQEDQQEEDKANNNNKKTKDTVEIGNVTSETVVTFEYGVRKDFKKEEFQQLKALPFQLQIVYTKLDGMKCMRSITKLQEITFDRKQAEEKANIQVLGVNAFQQSAKLASKGNYNEARAYNFLNKNLLNRAAQDSQQQQQVTNWMSKGQQLEEELVSVQKKEREEGLFLDLDDHEEMEQVDEDESKSEKEQVSKEKKAMKKKMNEEKSKSRKNQRTDQTAAMLYNFKSTGKF